MKTDHERAQARLQEIKRSWEQLNAIGRIDVAWLITQTVNLLATLSHVQVERDLLVKHLRNYVTAAQFRDVMREIARRPRHG